MRQVPPEAMEPPPDFAGRTIPQEATLGDFRLTMLTAADLDEDMAAIEESAAELDGMFGDSWPRGLTREADRADLDRHHREFTSGGAFAWVIRDHGGAYLGCAYVRPASGQPGAARVVHWMRTPAAVRGPAFAALFHNWLRGPDWPTLEMTITSRP
ncbi:MAG: hypothetical protein ACTSXZ_06795 [Alphaproteobacteria bacterium]